MSSCLIYTERGINSLLLSCLGALGSAGIVADVTAETHGHGDVTVVHRDYCHLLTRRPLRQTQMTYLRLKREEIEKKLQIKNKQDEHRFTETHFETRLFILFEDNESVVCSCKTINTFCYTLSTTLVKKVCVIVFIVHFHDCFLTYLSRLLNCALCNSFTIFNIIV